MLISTDFSELRKLELTPIGDEAAPVPRGNGSAASKDEFDLVLGQQVFGWKLNRKWALGLAGLLVFFLLLMTMFFTNRASQAERDQLREQFRPRTMEGE